MLMKVIYTCLLFEVVLSEFYVGMYEDDDYLVSRDFVHKQATPRKRVSIEYGRLYKCPITYISVKDRVGLDGGPKVVIRKGGLRAKFFAINILSPPGLPVSVIVTVACTNPHEEKDIGNSTQNKDESTTPLADKGGNNAVGEDNNDKTNNTGNSEELDSVGAKEATTDTTMTTTTGDKQKSTEFGDTKDDKANPSGL